jgi:hypothetical protein
MYFFWNLKIQSAKSKKNNSACYKMKCVGLCYLIYTIKFNRKNDISFAILFISFIHKQDVASRALKNDFCYYC